MWFPLIPPSPTLVFALCRGVRGYRGSLGNFSLHRLEETKSSKKKGKFCDTVDGSFEIRDQLTS